MQIENFEMQRGDTPVIVAYNRDENNALVNDPAASFKLVARNKRGDPDPPVFQVTTPQYAAGEGRLPIPISATSGFTYDRVLYYDVQVQESNGNVNTLIGGTITVWVDAART